MPRRDINPMCKRSDEKHEKSRVDSILEVVAIKWLENMRCPTLNKQIVAAFL